MTESKVRLIMMIRKDDWLW